jgi:predicted nucleotidyltransferase
VDILVAFEGQTTFDRYFDLKFWLEDLLGRPVDLVTEKALRPELAADVLREALNVAP